jgi:hypothetical protein
MSMIDSKKEWIVGADPWHYTEVPTGNGSSMGFNEHGQGRQRIRGTRRQLFFPEIFDQENLFNHEEFPKKDSKGENGVLMHFPWCKTNRLRQSKKLGTRKDNTKTLFLVELESQLR